MKEGIYDAFVLEGRHEDAFCVADTKQRNSNNNNAKITSLLNGGAQGWSTPNFPDLGSPKISLKKGHIEGH